MLSDRKHLIVYKLVFRIYTWLQFNKKDRLPPYTSCRKTNPYLQSQIECAEIFLLFRLDRKSANIHQS